MDTHQPLIIEETPFYRTKRFKLILIIAGGVIIILVLVLGLTFGLKKHKSNPSNEISSCCDFVELSNGNYVLMNDLDCSNIELGNSFFEGTIEGNGYSISHLSLSGIGVLFMTFKGNMSNISFKNVTIGSTSVKSEFVGLFSSIEESILENITIEANLTYNITSTLVFDVGVLADSVRSSSLSNIYANIVINGYNHSSNDIGGLLNVADESTFNNITVEGSLNFYPNPNMNNFYFGGIASIIYSSYLKNCKSNVDITINALEETSSEEFVIGGLFGLVSGFDLRDCSYTGNITYLHPSWNTYIGGVAGSLFQTQAYSLNSFGKISSINGSFIGGIAGEGILFSCNDSSSAMSLEGNAHVGGLFGRTYSDDIFGCSFSGNITGVGTNPIYLGGLIGMKQANHDAASLIDILQNCHSKGFIQATDGTNVGGLFGIITIEHYSGLNLNKQDDLNYISDSHSEMNLAAKSNIGGLVGWVNMTYYQVNNSFFDGIILTQDPTSSNIGGIIGTVSNYSNLIISSCYSIGKIQSFGTQIGGLIGSLYQATIINTYSTIPLIGNSSIGGLIGCPLSNSVTFNITNSYSSGSIPTGDSNGGMIGYNSGSTTVPSITSSFWNTDTSGTTKSNGGAGKTSAELKIPGTFQGWDFDNIWKFSGSTGFPILQFSE